MRNRLFAASEAASATAHRVIPVRRIGIESDRRLGSLDGFRKLLRAEQREALHVIGEGIAGIDRSRLRQQVQLRGVRILGRGAPAVDAGAETRVSEPDHRLGVLRIDLYRTLEVVTGRCSAFLRRRLPERGPTTHHQINRVGIGGMRALLRLGLR